MSEEVIAWLTCDHRPVTAEGPRGKQVAGGWAGRVAG